jgi:putative hemolysin
MSTLLIVIFCLILNAILSCVEMAFVTVSKSHLKKIATSGDRLAEKVLALKNNPERVLSVLQIGITLVGAISAAVGGAGAEESLSPFFQSQFSLSEEASELLAIVTVVIPITYFSVVIGELVPKTLALRFPMRFAKFGGQFLGPLDRIFAPIVSLLELSTKVLTTLIFSKIKSESISDASSTIEIDSLTDVHKQYVLNLINVDKRRVKDIMLPWPEVTKIEVGYHRTEVLNVIKSSGHTRLPVLDGEKIIGILHSKEFIAESEISKIDWKQLLRPVQLINFDEPILNALKTLQSNKSHLGVVHKNNVYIGIVTMEDVFEEVVGEIYDEDDNPRALLSSNSHLRTMSLKKD